LLSFLKAPVETGLCFFIYSRCALNNCFPQQNTGKWPRLINAIWAGFLNRNLKIINPFRTLYMTANGVRLAVLDITGSYQIYYYECEWCPWTDAKIDGNI